MVIYKFRRPIKNYFNNINNNSKTCLLLVKFYTDKRNLY